MPAPKHHEQFYFTFVTFLVSRYHAAKLQLTVSIRSRTAYSEYLVTH
jgi:hypothetical protein